MTLDDAKEQLEALPGVYEVNLFIDRNDKQLRPSLRLIDKAPPGSEACDLYRVVRSDSTIEYVKFCVHCRSPEILPEETRQGILRIYETLERELGCFVSFAVSAGLRMPEETS